MAERTDTSRPPSAFGSAPEAAEQREQALREGLRNGVEVQKHAELITRTDAWLGEHHHAASGWELVNELEIALAAVIEGGRAEDRAELESIITFVKNEVGTTLDFDSALSAVRWQQGTWVACAQKLTRHIKELERQSAAIRADAVKVYVQGHRCLSQGGVLHLIDRLIEGHGLTDVARQELDALLTAPAPTPETKGGAMSEERTLEDVVTEAASALEALREELAAMKAARQRVRDSFGHRDADGNCRCVYCTRDLEGLCEHAADYEMRCHTRGMQITALREENAVLEGELAAIVADPTRSHAVQQLEAQLKAERQENARLQSGLLHAVDKLKSAQKENKRAYESTQRQRERAEQAEQRIAQLECDVHHWRDARQSAIEAADAFQAELAHWKVCVNCHQSLDAPGLCASGQDELEQGHRLMLEEWCAERDSLKKVFADLNEALTEVIKDRDYYEAQEKQARDRITQLEAALAEAHARGDRWSLLAQETEAPAENRERVAFEAGWQEGLYGGNPLTAVPLEEAWTAYRAQRYKAK